MEKRLELISMVPTARPRINSPNMTIPKFTRIVSPLRFSDKSAPVKFPPPGLFNFQLLVLPTRGMGRVRLLLTSFGAKSASAARNNQQARDRGVRLAVVTSSVAFHRVVRGGVPGQDFATLSRN